MACKPEIPYKIPSNPPVPADDDIVIMSGCYGNRGIAMTCEIDCIYKESCVREAGLED